MTRMLLLAICLCMPASAQTEEDHDHHLSEGAGLRALHAWTPATTSDTAMVYVELENITAEPVTLDGAETGLAETAHLVGFELKNGEAVYTVLPPMPLAPGREMHLEPEGMAIRLTGLARGLAEGETFEMHLETSLGEIGLFVSVEAANAGHHGHAGHTH
ncbi:copper chaperone PCu(A)C [Salipiger mucosus]|uniref:Copper metallochaperone n=1 Tax=Salipiger mucosus DSM 16094 TaxID=1123237 RepID=S9R032_9RHOB|nr:copper chaperone PCu(A)C [Salipiger mucosus]EPX85293.1 hypothetical protein Salmuc_02672 [Salipiger mucosus DSM 16094]